MHSLYRGNYNYITSISTAQALRALALCDELPSPTSPGLSIGIQGANMPTPRTRPCIPLLLAMLLLSATTVLAGSAAHMLRAPVFSPAGCRTSARCESEARGGLPGTVRHAALVLIRAANRDSGALSPRGWNRRDAPSQCPGARATGADRAPGRCRAGGGSLGG